MKLSEMVGQKSGPVIDMTPMIDIVFNLLLFFLLSSSYVQHSSLEVKLPQSTQSRELEGEAVVVDLTRDDRIFFNGKLVTLDELRAAMVTAYPEPGSDKPLLIRADAQAMHGRVIAILDIARAQKVKALNIATMPAGPAEAAAGE
jgi:biopolymer transport protein ExbD